MAATRKLQGEIDRCLKKVTEGVELFEDIWQKVHNAANSNQKEKYETDLKKEIKKLQRLRDQIKSWIQSAEIKDKSQLVENRKLIETQMERFKIVERETKTKAYSKEGLGAAQKLDPAQKEREDISQWLNTSIENLNIQIDQFECEIESLLAAKKKKLDKDKQERLDKLKEFLERHRFHIRKLETLLRMLDNLTVEVSQIKKIKDDIEYYIEAASTDPDFEENTYLYDDINFLDEFADVVGTVGGDGSHEEGSPSSPGTAPSPTSSPAMNHQGSGTNTTPSSTGTGAPATTPNDADERQKRTHRSSTDDSHPPKTPSQVAPVKPAPIKAPTKTVLTTPIKSSAAAVSHSTPNNSSPSSGSTMSNHISTPSTPQVNGAALAYSVVTREDGIQSLSLGNSNNSSGHADSSPISQQQSPAVTSTAQAPAPPPPQQQQPAAVPVVVPSKLISSTSVDSTGTVASSISTAPSPLPSAATPPSSSAATSSQPLVNGPSNKSGAESISLRAMAQHAVDQQVIQPAAPTSDPTANLLYSENNTNNNNNNNPGVVGSGRTVGTTSGQLSVPSSLVPQPPAPTGEAHIPPLLGVAPLGPVALSKEQQIQHQSLEAAFYHMPHPSDSERLRHYLPRSPYMTPPYYPQSVPLASDSLDFFHRLSTETLFFIFYYLEGTKAQYLAAKALKKQSWRFHTKYMMWFQRHEEPKTITEEYEQGTYIYFDYEKWGQRKKEGFTFEYRFLEDRDLN
ncbi:putative CCR4-NOT transcription complex subunit 3 [Daphnia sinensis]|uniref:CCR4-NOT transcription complex subunit 3 n=1 Tax=Daphnia sinensis TaxID=1820382 RepID=A0AAD5LS67_9CRUS|nr:putative CCR4-NOT transcription complex subunit 3 [Daphnia sinensis]